MPDVTTSDQSPQADENVSTPQVADKPTTTTPQPQTGDPFMNALDIPLEIQNQISGAQESETEPAEPVAAEAPAPAPETPSTDGEEEEGEEEPAAEADQPQKIDGRQKRINRLTRQKSQLQEQLDAYAAKSQQLEEKLAQYEQKAEPQPDIPDEEWLEGIRNEKDLSSVVKTAKAIINWCDANADGVTIAEGDKETYVSAEQVASKRRECEKKLLAAPLKLEAIKQFKAQNDYYNGLAQQAWPELFDRSSQEYQLGQSILRQFPTVARSAEANYALGLVIEGMKSVQQRVAAAQAQNGARRPHRDMDERAFAPRVPLAPESPEPPSRGRDVKASLHKKYSQASEKLIKDVDGSAQSLAAMFAAEDEMAGKKSGTRSTPVRV